MGFLLSPTADPWNASNKPQPRINTRLNNNGTKMEIPTEKSVTKRPNYFSEVMHKMIEIAGLLLSYIRVSDEDRIAAGIRIDNEK
jgi:hypothetical protein